MKVGSKTNGVENWSYDVAYTLWLIIYERPGKIFKAWFSLLTVQQPAMFNDCRSKIDMQSPWTYP